VQVHRTFIVKMPTLRIQHAVPSFDAWMQAFESDPVDRKGAGVRRYRILRPVSDPNFVMIDLDLDTLDEAEALLQKLRRLWSGAGQAVMRNPEAWIVQMIESTET
jgi:hypothetical protein